MAFRICPLCVHILIPLPRGHFKAMTDVLRTSCFRMYIGHSESELSSGLYTFEKPALRLAHCFG